MLQLRGTIHCAGKNWHIIAVSCCILGGLCKGLVELRYPSRERLSRILCNPMCYRAVLESFCAKRFAD